MGKFSDGLGGGNGGNADFDKLWDETEAAKDRVAIPSGTYECELVDGRIDHSPIKGTPSYTLEFIIRSGEHAGRHLWHACWLAPGSMPFAKRDLAKVGIKSRQQLENPPSPGQIFRVRCVLKREDDETERNEVKELTYLRTATPTDDPFAPSLGDAAEPDTPSDEPSPKGVPF